MITRDIVAEGALAALLAAALAGCATPDPGAASRTMSPRAGQLECPSASAACDVFVGVYCPGNPQAHCVITVDYNLVEIQPAHGANKVTWRLQPGGDFAFGGNGIGIDPNAFGCGANGPFTFTCTARGNGAGQFKYTVSVVPRGGSRVVDPLDPWVVTK